MWERLKPTVLPLLYLCAAGGLVTGADYLSARDWSAEGPVYIAVVTLIAGALRTLAQRLKLEAMPPATSPVPAEPTAQSAEN